MKSTPKPANLFLREPQIESRHGVLGGVGDLVRSAVPTEVSAGRLAEAEARSLKGAEPLVFAPADREQDGNAGAPEPKQIEFVTGIALRMGRLSR